MLTGVEQGKTSLQILQTDSTAGAVLFVCFDPMSGIADFHLELRACAKYMKVQSQGRGRGLPAVFDGIFDQRLKNDAWNQSCPCFVVDLAVDVQFPVKSSYLESQIAHRLAC
jgi:hypothetical protein